MKAKKGYKLKCRDDIGKWLKYYNRDNINKKEQIKSSCMNIHIGNKLYVRRKNDIK